MAWYQALVLGIVQGLTEFLPISSSGHLILVPELFGWGTQPLVFDLVLHLGTAAALVAFFWRDLWHIVLKDRKLGLLLFVGSVPAGILGFVFEDFLEATFRDALWVAVFLVLGSCLMFLAEKFGRQTTSAVSAKKSFLIGLFQSLALLPGMSRSGSTISGGMLVGLDRTQAARFSFLLSIPIVLVAAAFKLLDSSGQLVTLGFEVTALGFLSSFLVGILAMRFLLSFLKTHTLTAFIIYRLALVFVLLVVLM